MAECWAAVLGLMFVICLTFVEAELKFHSRTHTLNETQQLAHGRIVKRHLRWTYNNYIAGENDVGNLMIKSLVSYSNSQSINANKNYTGFTIYNNNSDRGTFHFISDVSTGNPCSTFHGNAYNRVFGHCPSSDTGIIASGYCYAGGKLGFNSGTFNNPLGRSYLDNNYYENNKGAVNAHEQQLLVGCFNSWKSANYQRSWTCNLQTTSLGFLTATECIDCDTYQPCGVDSNQAMQMYYNLPLVLIITYFGVFL